jgi:YVTN family beta-propeller protein
MIKKHAVSCTLILILLVVVVAVALLYSTYFPSERAWADSVIKNIPAGWSPIGVAFDSDNGYTYVTNVDSNTVSVIDGSTNTVIKNIPAGWSPIGVAFNPVY